jgi:hypothetical protein
MIQDIITTFVVVGATLYIIRYVLNRHKKCGCSKCVCSGDFKKI